MEAGSGAELGRIKGWAWVLWATATAGLLLLPDRDPAWAFGYGGLCKLINFSALGWLTDRFVKGAHTPGVVLLLGTGYILRLGLFFGALGAGLLWLELDPLFLAAGVAVVLFGSVAHVVMDKPAKSETTQRQEQER